MSHKSNICISVSASGSGAKSILRRVVTAALTGTVSALQIVFKFGSHCGLVLFF